MTRRASSVTLTRRRRGACQRSRIVILASSEPISGGRAGATIGLGKSAVNQDGPLLCRARRCSSAAADMLRAGVSFDPPDGEPPDQAFAVGIEARHEQWRIGAHAGLLRTMFVSASAANLIERRWLDAVV